LALTAELQTPEAEARPASGGALQALKRKLAAGAEAAAGGKGAKKSTAMARPTTMVGSSANPFARK
jgi:hypothetical protein